MESQSPQPESRPIQPKPEIHPVPTGATLKADLRGMLQRHKDRDRPWQTRE